MTAPEYAACVMTLHDADVDFRVACERLSAARRLYEADPIERNLRVFSFALRRAEQSTSRLLLLEDLVTRQSES